MASSGNVFEALVDVDGNGALVPGLVASWYTPDDLCWVFRLRPGRRLHKCGGESGRSVLRLKRGGP